MLLADLMVLGPKITVVLQVFLPFLICRDGSVLVKCNFSRALFFSYDHHQLLLCQAHLNIPSC